MKLQHFKSYSSLDKQEVTVVLDEFNQIPLIIENNNAASAADDDVGDGAVANCVKDRRLVNVEEHSVPPQYSIDVRAMCNDGRIIIGVGVCLYNPATRNVQILQERPPVYPQSAVMIDDTHLAVGYIVCGVCNITILTIGNYELRVEKVLYVPYLPRCLVPLNNGQLAVTWDFPPAFGVIDISGTRVVKKLYIDRDTNGRRFRYNYVSHMTVDERRQRVIWSSEKKMAVYCFDFKGKPVFAYSHPGLRDPRGVAVDKYGNIYVCDFYNDSIHHLFPNGDLISIITEGVPRGPMAICSDVTGTGFWVNGTPTLKFKRQFRREVLNATVAHFRLLYTFKYLGLRVLRALHIPFIWQ